MKHATVFIVGLLLGFGSLYTYSHSTVTHAQTVNGETIAEREARLQAELDKVLKEIEGQQAILNDERMKGASIERDLNIITAQINQAKLNIRARNIAIEALGKDINVKTQTINTLSGKIELSKESLGQLIRKTNEMDSYTVIDVVLSDKDISEFFADTEVYTNLKQSIKVTLGSIRKSKEDTEVAKQTLDKKRLQEIDAKISIEEEKKKIEVHEREKARLLNLSRTQQAGYQSEINKRQAQAAAIRSALFALRDTAAIPFGTALQYATEISKSTGVRPAFLLAILTQESELGKNIGTCNRAGDPPEKHWSVIMKPSRDIEPYKRITAKLGLNPDSMPLSCPWGTGWGGAMGPAQFIPSTWELFEARIQSIVGTTPSPWNAKHAFTASALYLSDLGASSQAYSAERNAACRYYSGRACDAQKPANAFYGDQVMAKAQNIQANMIDPLNNL